MSEVLSRTADWIGELFDGLDAVGTEDPNDALLQRAISDIVSLRAQVAAIPRRRPSLAFWKPLSDLVDELIALALVEMRTAEASTPDAAVAFQATGQAHLDTASATVHLLNERLTWWSSDHSIRLPESVIAAAAEAYRATAATSLTDLDARGMALYTRITNRSDGPIGIGVGLLLDLGLVDRAFDEDRLYLVARSVYEHLDRNRAGFRQLLDHSDWRADLLHARRVFYDSRLTAEAVLDHLAGERRVEAKVAIQLGAQMTEQVSRTALALILASDPSSKVKRTDGYEKLHTAAGAAGLRDSLVGLDGRIRNAHAHEDFEVGADYVLLGRNHARPQKVSDEDLVDTVLASVESCAALFAAIDCVIAEECHPAAHDWMADQPVEHVLLMMASAIGIEQAEIRMRRTQLTIAGSERPGVRLNPMTGIAALVPYTPDWIEQITLRLRRDDENLVAIADIAPFRRFVSSEPGVTKDLAFIESLGRATIAGKAVLSAAHVRYLLALQVHGLLAADFAEVEVHAPAIAAASRTLGHPTLADAVDAFVQIRIAKAQGRLVDRATIRRYNRLARSLAIPPGPWNDGTPPSARPA